MKKENLENILKCLVATACVWVTFEIFVFIIIGLENGWLY